MTAEAAEEQDDARARLVSAFLSGVRSGTAHAEDLRWSREYTEHVLVITLNELPRVCSAKFPTRWLWSA